MSNKSSVVSFFLSLILWILGAMTYVFNLYGMWEPWHLAGFAFVFYLIIPAIAQLVALGKSLTGGRAGLFFFNILTTAISVIVTLFTVSISATWMW